MDNPITAKHSNSSSLLLTSNILSYHNCWSKKISNLDVSWADAKQRCQKEAWNGRPACELLHVPVGSACRKYSDLLAVLQGKFSTGCGTEELISACVGCVVRNGWGLRQLAGCFCPDYLLHNSSLKRCKSQQSRLLWCRWNSDGVLFLTFPSETISCLFHVGFIGKGVCL